MIACGLKALVGALLLLAAAPARAADPIAEQDAYEIGVDAYTYLFPLVLMDVTRRQATNIEPGKMIGRPAVDMKTAPMLQVTGLTPARFFAVAAELLKVNPPHITDQPIIARLRRIGFIAGQSFDLDNADPAVMAALQRAAPDAFARVKAKIPTLAANVNGWLMNTTSMGVYGNYYLKRTGVALFGLGANLPEDAIYPNNLADADGKPLSGDNSYTLHFDKGALPPVEAFWSVTLYDEQGFLTANALDRHAIGDRDPLKLNADGSLDLYVQTASPGPDKESNWLPAPAGPFNLLMRLYAPRAEALDGRWAPPPASKAQ